MSTNQTNKTVQNKQSLNPSRKVFNSYKNSYQLDSVTQRVILGFEIGRPILPTNEDYAHTTFHVSGFSVLVDLWLVKINKPMILCARSTLISSKQSTKRGSREIHEVRKGMWASFS